MRARSLVVIVAIFGSAALASALLVREVRRAIASGLAELPAPAAPAPGGAAPGAGASPGAPRAGTGSVEGTVRDPLGRALAGVWIRVERGDGAPALEARTDFDGAWRVGGVEAGRAAVVARQEGVALGTSQAVQVREGHASRADLVLPPAGLLSGRVSPGAGGVAVVAAALSPGAGAVQVARAPADASGSFSMSLPAGEYRVHTAPAGAAATDSRASPAFARVVAGRTTRLELAAPPPPARRGVELLVLDPGGAPSRRAVVTVRRPGDRAVAFATTAGEDGRVVLAPEMGIAGRVVVRARNGDRAAEATLVLPEEGTVPLALTPFPAEERDRRGVDGALAR
jgi:hypothetical protein